jgi:SAM-dependent methyltransferase
MTQIDPRDPAAYGDRYAEVYDRIYGERFDTQQAVDTLASLTGGGRLLELGIGTGRLALPLLERGVAVDGIEGSRAMIERLSAQVDDRLTIYEADLVDFALPRRDYAVAVCAVSTLFMLPGQAAQTGILRCAAQHLALGGRVVIEAFVPDPSRFDEHGERREQRQRADGSEHVVHSRHDPDRQTIHITHDITQPAGPLHYAVTLHYQHPAQLDALAADAGLTLTERWGDWRGKPASAGDHDPISVYRRSDDTATRE